MTPFICIIPARLASTRLPNKPLADIAGKPMIVRVAERANASGATEVYVATDHAEVKAVCEAHQIRALMTSKDHQSGTERLAEVALQLQLDDDALVVNVQGDEPLIDPALIDAVAHRLHDVPGAAIATAAHRITVVADFLNPNVVKVVCGASGMAQYFSRAPIPYPRDAVEVLQGSASTLPAALVALRHIGIYAYRAKFLKQFATLTPAPAEQAEALEQLRALHHGFGIAVMEWQGSVAVGVDTEDDLRRVRALLV